MQHISQGMDHRAGNRYKIMKLHEKCSPLCLKCFQNSDHKQFSECLAMTKMANTQTILFNLQRLSLCSHLFWGEGEVTEDRI